MLTCPNCRSENDGESVTCFTCGSSLSSTTAIKRGSVIAQRYEILEPLGKGGMGMVYKAMDRDLDEVVALKLLRQDIAADPEMQKRFRSEIKLARKVRHRNVCGIHEFGGDGNLRFIAMEYLEGVDLRHVLQRKGAPLPEEAFEISIQVGQGLQAIHDAGIVHRDLKTPNIMRDKVGHVRLMDFGIAKQIGAEATMGATQMGMIVGTPEYMSPEQARGEKIDFRSDIYAWGIVTFEIFTGVVPFRGDTPIATIFKHLQEEPPLQGAGLPESLIPVLTKSLAKSPGDRYNNCNEMVDALQAARAVAFPNWRPSPSGSMRAPTGRDATPVPSTGVLPTPMPTRVPQQAPTVTKEAQRTPPPQPTMATPAPVLGATMQTPAPSAEAQQRQARVRDLLARAEGLASAQKLEDARSVLREAAQIEPSSTLVNRLLAQTEADLKKYTEAQDRAARAEAERQEALRREAEQKAEAERVAREQAAAEGAAAAKVEHQRRAQAERTAREQAAANADRQKREQAEAAQKQREAQEQAKQLEAQQREAQQREAAERQAKADEKKRAAEEAQRKEAQRKAEAERQAQDARRQEELRRQQEAERQERARQQASSRPAAAVPATSEAPGDQKSGAPGWLLPAAAAGVLVVLGIGGYLLTRGDKPSVVVDQPVRPSLAPAPPSLVAEAVPVAPPGMGVVVVDAQPWAEVVEVVDAKGKRHALGGAAFTPLTLSLPPGEYNISLRHPTSQQPRSLVARVAASGAPVRLSADFQRVDVQDYFKKTGW